MADLPCGYQEVLHFVVENNFQICQIGQHPHFVIGMVAHVRKKDGSEAH